MPRLTRSGDHVVHHARATTHAAPGRGTAPSTRADAAPSKSDVWEPPKDIVAQWAANFPARKVVPHVDPNANSRGFNAAQYKAIHHLFWTAPVGASPDDILKLAAKDPAFKGDPPTRDQLNNLPKYRPDSFPFTFADRQRSMSSFVLIETLLHTPADVPLEDVFSKLTKEIPGFMSQPALGRMARRGWAAEPKLFPFAKKLPRSEHGEGFALKTQGKISGLPRFGDTLALSPQLARTVSDLVDDPRIQYGWEMPEILALVSKDLGVEFTYQQWKHLREKFPSIPDVFEVQASARKRFAELVRTVWKEHHLTSGTDLADLLHKDYGYPVYDSARFVALREEFPKLIPGFRAAQKSQFEIDGEAFVTAVNAHPNDTFEQIGARLGFDANRVKALVRMVRITDPAAIAARQNRQPPFTAADKKALQAALDASPVGSTMQELLDELPGAAPEFAARHPLRDGDELARVVRRELGIDDWLAHERLRLEQLVTRVAKGADAGVSLQEIHDHLRDEFGARVSYTQLKSVIREAEAHPARHHDLAKIRNSAGRYPWEIGFDFTKSLAQTVGDAMRAHPKQTLDEDVATLMKDPSFAAKYPTFGKVHIQQLRIRFPDQIPYIDEIREGRENRGHKVAAARLDALAKKLTHTVDELPDDAPPTVTGLARKLHLEPQQVRAAVVRHPELFPWYRQRPTGNIDLALAYRVAAVMESAPLGATLGDLEKTLEKDAAFRERYPAFSAKTVNALQEQYPEIVGEWATRNQLLRSALLAEAIREAPKGTPFEKVAASLDKQYPGQFSKMYANEAALRWLWKSDPERFAFAEDVLKAGLSGMGKPHEASSDSPSEIATRAGRLARVPLKLDLVESLVHQVKNQPLDSGGRYEFVLVQHLLDSQIPTFDALKRLGMKASRTSVIGIPYSASDLVVDELQDDGWDVQVPPLDIEKWVEDVRQVLYARLESALEHHRDIVVMDDGGITTELIANDPVLRAHAQIFRTVEQTRRGITVADEVDTAAPVVNVAQSWAKFVEGPLIGNSVQDKLVERLGRVGVKSLKGQHVGIIGAGTIGLPIAEQLKALGATVTLYDVSEAALQKAEKAHLHTETDRKKFFSHQDIIIGATGVRTMEAEDFENLKPGAIIGSASSKLVEIDVEALADLSKGRNKKPRMDVVDEQSHPPSVRYELAGGKKVTLLARGFPLNFDGGAENISPEHIQLTRALMVLGLLQATREKVPGVKRLDPRLELTLLENFKKLGVTDASPDTEKALKEAMVELEKAVKHQGGEYRRHTS